MILEKLTKINDEEIEELLLTQVSRPGDRWDGGAHNMWKVVNTQDTGTFFKTVAQSYASPHSRYYLSEELEEPMERAVTCILNTQHEDGTIDLHSTNFHSTPDTAFLVNDICPIFVVLKRLNRPSIDNIIKNVEKFLIKAGECLTVGGVHTPNHRWVVCSALARVNSFFPNQKYVDRIDQWLDEEIDLDKEGQYSERSVGGYSAVCDNMLLTTGIHLNRPELFDYIRKNLDMTLYYIQPSGEVLSNASNRQDKGEIAFSSIYYRAYKYFANMDKNPVYAAVCKMIEEKIPEELTRFIGELLEDPILNEDNVSPSKIPDDYFKRYSDAGVIRIRRGKKDISILDRNATFLVYMKGNAVLNSIRVASCFFGTRGQFYAGRAKLEENTIKFTKSVIHGYSQPWTIINGKVEQPKSGMLTMDYEVNITEEEGNASVEIEIKGTPYVPVSIELNFRKEGKLSGVIEDKNLDDAYFLENGMGKYTIGDDTIHFGPSICEHKWAIIRGMLEKQEGKSVYLTGYTPFKYTLELR